MMKFTKYLLLFTITLVFYNCSSTKNTNQSSEQTTQSSDRATQIEERMNTLSAKLNLTDEQEIQFRNINEKYNNEMQSLRNSGGDRQSKIQSMRSIQERRNKDVQIILTDSQYQIYLDEMEKQRAQMRGRRGL